MATVPPVRWAFSPLDEELGLRPNVGFTPKVQEGMARLGTWMPFRAAQRELAFFLGVDVAEATVRLLTELAGATQVQVQAAEVETLRSRRPESPEGPDVQLMSLDGALIQMVSGEWKEVKTLALGVVSEAKRKHKKPPAGERQVRTSALSYFSRMSEAESFQQEPLGEVHRRGVEKAKTVCAVSDGADWMQKWVDYHRPDALRILDFPHAMEYVSQGGQAAYEHLPRPPEDQRLTGPQATKRQQQRFEQWLSKQGHELKTGDVAKVLAELERLRSLMQQAGQREAVETLDKSLFYLRRRPQMTTYARFRAQGYPIGSGSVESANKLVVQSRMKQAGMRWGPGHVNAMLAMRNLACNDRWREGWAAIGERWRQQTAAARAQRALHPAVSGEKTSSAALTLPSSAEAASSAEPKEGGATLAQPVSDHLPSASPAPRSSRPAATHPWRRPFIRRRSA